MIAARFPQYEILNGAVGSYSPSNYLNVTRSLLNARVEFDEVIVFLDLSDVQDEAAYYYDLDASGAVGKRPQDWYSPSYRYQNLRAKIAREFLLTNYAFEFLERTLVDHGVYYLYRDMPGNLFDLERVAWSYRPVSQTRGYPQGYGPLGVEGGIAKEIAKMNLLWQALAAHHIALKVVVYPCAPQVVHDTAESRYVVMWRDWCAGKCQDFVSLFPAFLAEKERCPRSEPGCWYRKDFIFGDFHYSVAGNTLVADAVSRSLLADPPRKRYSAAE
jgi:hypothetical protein